jgi:hypothetical protein
VVDGLHKAPQLARVDVGKQDAGQFLVALGPGGARPCAACSEAHQHRTPIVGVRATDDETGVFEAINKLAVAQRDARSSASEVLLTD